MAGNPNDVFMSNYRKWTNSLVDGENADEFIYKVYEQVCNNHPVYPGNIFPVAMIPEVVARNPVVLEVAQWGRLECPTINALIQKIVTAYEQVKQEEWNEKYKTNKGSSSVQSEE